MRRRTRSSKHTLRRNGRRQSYAKKIDDSLKKAVALRKKAMPKLKRFVFLTPVDLTHEGHLHLFTNAEKQGLKAEAWGESKLLAILTEHPEVKSEFPALLLPDLIEEIRAARAEQITIGDDPIKTRHQLAEQIFTTVSELLDALRPWKSLSSTFEELAPVLNRLVPLCGKLHKRALLYLPSEVASDIEAIVGHVNQIYAADQNWRMYRALKAGRTYASSIEEQFDRAHRYHPEQIEKIWERLGATLQRIVKESFSRANDDDRYRKWIAAILPEVLRNARGNLSLSLNLDDPDVALAYRAKKEGDLDVLLIGSSLVLLPPGSINHDAP